MDRISSLGVIVIVLANSIALATDPPASKVNPQSGDTEIVDLVADSGYHQVRHTNDDGSGRPPTVQLTSTSSNNLRPRIAISAAGDTWVVWYRDTAIDQVLVRKRDHTTGSWSPERLLSASSEDSQLPFIVHDGTDPWVAFEFDNGTDTSVAVNIITDEPDPIPNRTVVATTLYAGDVDVQIHSESGNLWVTWADSSSGAGFSEFDYQTDTWSTPDYESHASDTIADARVRIRAQVLAN